MSVCMSNMLFVRFGVRAARNIEANPLAHEASGGCRRAARTIGQAGDSGIARRCPGGYCEKARRRAESFSGRALAVEFVSERLQALRTVPPADGDNRARPECWAKQCRQPAREVVAGGGRERRIEIGHRPHRCDVDALQLIARFGLALERREAKCSPPAARRWPRSRWRWRRRSRNPAATPAASPAPRPGHCARRVPAACKRSNALASSARHATISSVCARAPTRVTKAIAGFAHLARIQAAQYRTRAAAPSSRLRSASKSGRTTEALE